MGLSVSEKDRDYNARTSKTGDRDLDAATVAPFWICSHD